MTIKNILADETSVTFDDLQAATHEILEDAQAWRDLAEIDTEDRAIRAGDLVRKITAHEKAIEVARVAEKEPHLAAGKAVDARYKPLATAAAAAKEAVNKLLSGWLKRKAEENRAAEERARQIAAEAAAKAAAAAQEARTIADQIEAEQASIAAAELSLRAEKIAAKKVAIGSQADGRAISLRRAPAKARIVDPKAAETWAWNAHRAEMLAEIERLASADARAGAESIPGCEIYREERVA